MDVESFRDEVLQNGGVSLLIRITNLCQREEAVLEEATKMMRSVCSMERSFFGCFGGFSRREGVADGNRPEHGGDDHHDDVVLPAKRNDLHALHAFHRMDPCRGERGRLQDALGRGRFPARLRRS